MKILCLPFAGAGYYSYRPVFANDRYFEPVFCLLPGRERRFGEAPVTSLYEAADDLYRQLRDSLSGEYVIWGHSMGAELARLLLEKIRGEQAPLPLHLFISGREAPSVDKRNQHYLLPKHQFREELKRLGGVPAEIMDNEEFMDFFEPILRNDFKLIETFYEPELKLLSVPLSVMIGSSDDVSREEALSWQKITSGPFDLKIFPGNHFFIFEHTDEFLAYLRQRITECDAVAKYPHKW